MNTANIDFTGHQAEMTYLDEQERETMASKEYLDYLRNDLAEEQRRLNQATQGALPVVQGPKSNKERQDAMRKKRLAAGLKRGDVWARPDDWPLLRELEQKLRSAREIKPPEK